MQPAIAAQQYSDNMCVSIGHALQHACKEHAMLIVTTICVCVGGGGLIRPSVRLNQTTPYTERDDRGGLLHPTKLYIC